jgi:hypothetical protein
MVKYKNIIPYIPREDVMANFRLIPHHDCVMQRERRNN